MIWPGGTLIPEQILFLTPFSSLSRLISARWHSYSGGDSIFISEQGEIVTLKVI